MSQNRRRPRTQGPSPHDNLLSDLPPPLRSILEAVPAHCAADAGDGARSAAAAAADMNPTTADGAEPEGVQHDLNRRPAPPVNRYYAPGKEFMLWKSLRERVGAQVLQHGSGAGERRVRRERAPALQADAR